jgi:glycosyltransferase involved in cell wall biosynthesis
VEFSLNKEKPLVSICIPSYNASAHIEETIASVLDSTYSKLEVIVNDDASTDNTAEIVKGIADKRIFLFENTENLGPARNWNRAMRRATGELVGLLNHDDLYGPFWLTFAVHVLEKYPHIGWVAGAYSIIDDKGETLKIVSRFHETREYGLSEAFLCVAQFGSIGPGYIARRQVLEEIGYYDEDGGPFADNDLFQRLSSRYPLFYSVNPHISWRRHDGNLSNMCRPIAHAEARFHILNKIFSDESLSEELHEHKTYCYDFNYRNLLLWVKKRLEQGDIETARRLMGVLYKNGYRD